MDPLYTLGLFIILVLTTSAGVLIVAAISPEQPLGKKNYNEQLKGNEKYVHCLK